MWRGEQWAPSRCCDDRAVTSIEQYPYRPPETHHGGGQGLGGDHRHDSPAGRGTGGRRPREDEAPGESHGQAQGHGHGHSHGHSHSHGPAAPVSRHLRKVIAAILIPFTAAVVVGLLVLW
ncbi:hypothetical protein ABZ919_29810, partial [Streptomyces sp. NPDC046759]